VTVDPGASIGPSRKSAPHDHWTPCRDWSACADRARMPYRRPGQHHARLHRRPGDHSPGARLGQDGFGFSLSAKGHLKTPQLGRVIIQDDVEIGANTTIDRVRFGTR